MAPSTFNVQLTVYSGRPRDGKSPILFAYLRSPNLECPENPSELVLLCYEEAGIPPPWISRLTVNPHDVAWLRALAFLAGFPTRRPRVIAKKAKLSAERKSIVLELCLGEARACWSFATAGSGFVGADSEPLRELLELLGNLAQSGGRPRIHAVLKDLAGEPATSDFTLD
jgi:hypothetical protein